MGGRGGGRGGQREGKVRVLRKRGRWFDRKNGLRESYVLRGPCVESDQATKTPKGGHRGCHVWRIIYVGSIHETEPNLAAVTPSCTRPAGRAACERKLHQRNQAKKTTATVCPHRVIAVFESGKKHDNDRKKTTQNASSFVCCTQDKIAALLPGGRSADRAVDGKCTARRQLEHKHFLRRKHSKNISHITSRPHESSPTSQLYLYSAANASFNASPPRPPKPLTPIHK